MTVKLRPYAAVLLSALLCACAGGPVLDQAEIAASTPAEEPQAAVTPEPEPEPEPVYRPFADETFYRLLVAEVAARSNHLDIALDNYTTEAQENTDIGVAARATRIAQYMKRYGDAQRSALRWVELDPDSTEARFTASTLLSRNGQHLQAFEQMLRLEELGGAANFAYIADNAGRSANRHQQILNRAFISALEKTPDSDTLLFGHAVTLQHLTQTEDALRQLQRSLELEPGNIAAITLEARLLFELNRQEEAINRLHDTLAQYPENRRLRLQLARLLTRQDLSRAHTQFAILVEQSPGDPEMRLALAMVSKEIGMIDVARRHFFRLIDLGKFVAESHYYLGLIAIERKEIEAAILHLTQVPGSSSEYLSALEHYTDMMRQQGRLAEAMDLLNRRRLEDPRHSDMIYLLQAETLMEIKLYSEAHQLLSEALETSPDQTQLLYARSMASEKRGDIVLLEQDLRKILSINPQNATALNALGYSLANHTERYDEAKMLIEQALSLRPDDAAILDSMGWVLYRLGDMNTALSYLRRAIAKFPDHEVAAHLGEVLWELNQQEEATSVWQKALDAKPDSIYLIDVIRRYNAPIIIQD